MSDIENVDETPVDQPKSAPDDRAVAGPFDESEANPVRPYVDLGGVKVLPREGLHLRLEVEEGTKRVVAIGLAASGNLTDGHSALSFAGLSSILMSLSTFALVLLFLWFGLLLPTLAVQVRRLHDLGMSGQWLWITWAPALLAVVVRFVALASQSFMLLAVSDWISWLAWGLFVVLLAIYCRPGMVGENRYGLDPKGGGANLAETFR